MDEINTSTISSYHEIMVIIQKSVDKFMYWPELVGVGGRITEAWFSSIRDDKNAFTDNTSGLLNYWNTHAGYIFMNRYVTSQRPAL